MIRPSTEPLLPGFDLPSAERPDRRAWRPDRLYFALLPGLEIGEQARRLAWRLRDRHRLRGWPERRDRLHVSLAGLGDHVGLPEGLVAAATRAAHDVAHPPFALGFDRVASFRGAARRPLVLFGGGDTAGVVSLAGTLRRSLAEAGIRLPPLAGFTPHLTLLYDEAEVPTEPVPPIGWTVRSFTLVHGLVGTGRAVVLGTWTLDG